MILMLTELEGAILSEIQNRGQNTTFRVSRAFADSHSLEWKGSAGAVYPAVKRLAEKRYLLATATKGGRGTRRLALTDAGCAALMEWACDVRLAASIGIDPFRLRSGIWTELQPEQRKGLFASLRAEISASLAVLRQTLGTTDPIERVRLGQAIQVQQARLRTLSRWQSGGID
jgi:DNA-binding PadR family transcriptional regulator